MNKKQNKTTGDRGEKLAEQFLREKRHRILKNNYRTPVGEIDILTNDHGCVVIVEVKTKTNPNFGHPAEMVGFIKQKKLITLARFIQKVYPGEDIRIDVVAVDLSTAPPTVEHIENAVTT